MKNVSIDYLNKVLKPYLIWSKDKLSEFLNLLFFLKKVNLKQKMFLLPFLFKSKSQYFQDLFVISQLSERQLPEFFVEFGATDGLRFSNTYLLENIFKWQGIVSEPAKIWKNELKNNRNCIIDTRCVYNKSGQEVEFSETLNSNSDYNISSPELSTISQFVDNGDWASNVRKNNSISYLVETISLNDLLLQNNAPFNIGYMSIDTEGSELFILNSYDFTKHRIEIISIEHNNNLDNRNLIDNLMSKNGYQRVLDFTFGADDIYILNEPIFK